MSTEETAAGETVDGNPDERSTGEEPSRADLRAQLELLRAENRRLRREYVRARQSRHRRTAIALLCVGGVGIAGGVLLPGAREVLLALGGSAIIAGILTYYLTPESFVALSVGDALITTLQDTYEAIRVELNLAGAPVYVPLPDNGAPDARLFLPQHRSYSIPGVEALRDTFVVTDDPESRGVALRPTGSGLFAEFRDASGAGTLSADDPERIFESLADGLVEQFELAERIVIELESENRCVIAVTGAESDDVDRLDHPIVSFLAVGAATTVQEPTRIEVRETSGREYVVECRWGDDVADSKESGSGG